MPVEVFGSGRAQHTPDRARDGHAVRREGPQHPCRNSQFKGKHRALVLAIRTMSRNGYGPVCDRSRSQQGIKSYRDHVLLGTGHHASVRFFLPLAISMYVRSVESSRCCCYCREVGPSTMFNNCKRKDDKDISLDIAFGKAHPFLGGCKNPNLTYPKPTKTYINSTDQQDSTRHPKLLSTLLNRSLD